MVTVLEKAPDFTAPPPPARASSWRSRSQSRRGKWVVLFFYPLDFTFVCPTEILEFSKRAKSSRRWARR